MCLYAQSPPIGGEVTSTTTTHLLSDMNWCTMTLTDFRLTLKSLMMQENTAALSIMETLLILINLTAVSKYKVATLVVIIQNTVYD